MSKPLNSILVIDDNPTDVFIIQQYLNRVVSDYELTSKGNGLEGIEYFRAEKEKASEGEIFQHQLVMLDINMPKMTGFEFMDCFEEEFSDDVFFKDTIIVVCSSSQNEEDLKNAFERERINDFIVKPIQQNKLQEVIDDYFS